ncbi:MAG: Ig-like domain-containing protein [Desulfuromonadales bacterium]|nr:Ig-like domain-containing protein [Desulfuromonadales bacterium]
MIKLLWSGMVVMLMLSGCGWNGTPTRNNDFVPLTSIQIIPVSTPIAASKTIAAHTSTRLSVVGNFSGLFTRDITSQAVWSSNTPTVAEFITAGSPERVTGHIPGTAVLTATVQGVSATCSLTVSSATITTLTITPTNPTVAKGLPIQFAAIGTFSDATTQDLTFDATWISSDPAVATVSDSAVSKGLAQTLTAGTTTIRATFIDIAATTLSGTTLLTVTVPVLQSIAVLPANPSVLSLSGKSFTATGTYSDGTTRDITSQVAWASSIPVRATIISGGAATTLSEGTTSISATLANASGVPVVGSTNLKVTGGTLTGITLASDTVPPVNNTITLVRNSVARISATGTFSNGVTRDITGAVAWAVTNSTLGTVTHPAGNLAWLNSGAVIGATSLTATSGTLVATAGLAVTAPTLTSLSISPTSFPDLTLGTSSRFTLTANFNDSTTQDVTVGAAWSSLAGTTALVGDAGILKGRVSGVAAGSTTISATYGVFTVTAPVTVRSRTIQSLTISVTPTISGTPTIVSGNQVKFAATAVYTDGTSKDVTEETTWAIDKSTVVLLADTLNQPGQVVAVDSGSATLTASFGGKTATATITVP